MKGIYRKREILYMPFKKRKMIRGILKIVDISRKVSILQKDEIFRVQFLYYYGDMYYNKERDGWSAFWNGVHISLT